MPLTDEKIDELISRFGIVIDDEAVAEEVELRHQQRLHHFKYEGLRTGSFAEYYRAAMTGPDPEDQAEARRAVALERLIDAVIKEQGLDATPEELEAEAQRLAESEHATLNMVRGFFGDDYGLLKRDVLEHKALEILESL